MSKTKQREEPEDKEQRGHEALNALIEEQLIHTLGVPDSLFRVQVRRLWQDRYRVNVFVGVDASSAKIAHSYFVMADGDGHIIASTPKLANRY